MASMAGERRTIELRDIGGGRATASVEVQDPGLYHFSDGVRVALGAVGALNPIEMGDVRALVTPENWVRDYIQEHRNHFPALEECAETLGGALIMGRNTWDSLPVKPLSKRLNIVVSSNSQLTEHVAGSVAEAVGIALEQGYQRIYGIGGARISAQDGCTVRMDPDGSIVAASGVTEQGQGWQQGHPLEQGASFHGSALCEVSAIDHTEPELLQRASNCPDAGPL